VIFNFLDGARVHGFPPPPAGIVAPEVSPWLLVALFGGALVLICGHGAPLLLARDAPRRRELAQQTALGASRHRLVRQILTESVILDLLGGGAGPLLAASAIHLLPALAPASLNSRTPISAARPKGASAWSRTVIAAGDKLKEGGALDLLVRLQLCDRGMWSETQAFGLGYGAAPAPTSRIRICALASYAKTLDNKRISANTINYLGQTQGRSKDERGSAPIFARWREAVRDVRPIRQRT
jgi:hypothetical protein